MNIVLISFTDIDASGGVPRWNRDLMSCLSRYHHVTHYSWDWLKKQAGKDVNLPEWEKAKILNNALISRGLITGDEIVLVDGFWGLGLEWHPNVISVCHGNWSHTTLSDVKKGLKPEFPLHHHIQLEYRQMHNKKHGRMVAVSQFIAEQMDLQWGFDVPVINNGIDTKIWKPCVKVERKKPLIIHGVTTSNKGFEHIKAVEENVDADVFLLDDAASYFGLDKISALAQADVVIHPSAHEGNSYFVLETMACNVPIVSYDVGLMREISLCEDSIRVGQIIDREIRSPDETLKVIKDLFYRIKEKDLTLYPRSVAKKYTIERFGKEWKDYLSWEFHK